MLDDPRRGTFDTIFGVLMVKSRSSQWYQELRLQSSFDGPVNFIFGANYLKYKVDEDYYVFNNLFTASARTIFGGGQAGNPVKDCYNYVPISAFDTCVYTDQNTINRIDGDGHNYFRSKNLNKTELKKIIKIGRASYRVRVCHYG